MKIIIVAIILIVSSVDAGGWANGYGPTRERATEQAYKNAEKIVASRGSGCLSGDIQELPKKDGEYGMAVFYAHHDGSCSKGSWVDDAKNVLDIFNPF
mmetsp:Transcript_10688/g.9647  ORF Transcript_10688/g.9647 Transcript_10688/m.9647 type:complete len:98 (-) Transcript_10688:155-448(-)|eukprot:CAMPEP_0201587210 /NCGR_PEP_ID=MMETSP0190_2-20130828/141444_1 /ASSEMBLY_ACC=CAM_ASM_000263 /TAXON_ID=37353 /ORGANISM="Rosalina sp." /LENGTH=97 /DNA_ID=CAMNT_0048036807 /DNA_START=54 /DNA_END=347 /DNA_ORIENTATION=+